MRAISSGKASSSSSSSLSQAGNSTLPISLKSEGARIRSHPCLWDIPCSSGRSKRKTVDYPSRLSSQLCPTAVAMDYASEWRQAYCIRCGRRLGLDTWRLLLRQDTDSLRIAESASEMRGPKSASGGYRRVVRELPPITERSTFLVLERSLH